MPERHTAGTDPAVIAHVIGQTPRPDLATDLQRRFPSTRFRIVGAMDGVQPEGIAPLAIGGHPLETLLRDGNRVILDAGFVAPLLQDAIEAHDADASAHLILCAGPFPELAAPATPSGHRTPLIRPFHVGVAEFRKRGHHRLDLMVPFAGYGFNKAHAVSYAYIAYWTAYFKANHPTEFLAAVLDSASGNPEKVGDAIREATRIGITVEPPSINHSRSGFTIERDSDGNDAIRFGLAAIKNVGASAIDPIVEAREASGPFKDIEDI